MDFDTLGAIKAVSVTTAAQDVNTAGRCFLIQNNSATGVYVYFKEKSRDGVAATASNAYRLDGGERMEVPVRATTLSVIGSASANVIIQYLE